MFLQRTNRYCGLVLKKGSWPVNFTSTEDLPLHTSIKSNYRVLHSAPIEKSHVFDGLIYNTDSLFTPKMAHYEGNWSMAFLDDENLILSRDRVGVRTIYYTENEDYFAFANEVKHLLNLQLLPFQVSSSAVFRFLFLDDQDVIDDSLIEGLKECPPGNRIIYHLNSHKSEISGYEEFDLKDMDEANMEQIQNQLKLKIQSPVQQILSNLTDVGSLLSGGMDSSVIATEVMQTAVGKSIPFITAISNYEQMNETKFAGSVVEYLKIKNWHQVVVSHLEKGLEELHYAMEFPTLSAGSFMQFELFRFAAFHKSKFLLDGTGADALFAGHQYYQAIHWNALIRSGQIGLLRKEVSRKKLGYFWFPYYLKNVAKYHTRGKMPVRAKYRSLLTHNSILDALNRDFVNEHMDILEGDLSRKMNNLNTFLAEDFFEGGVRKLLRFPDRIGKYFGVTNCSIFADNVELYKFALQLPASCKIQNGINKYSLREAYRKELPEIVINRKDKMGLVAPNNHWLIQHKELLLDYINDDLEEFFDVQKIKKTLSHTIDRLGPVENYKIFKFISFAVWHKVFKQKYTR